MSTFKRETSGPEQAEAEVEGEIREFVRRDIADLRRPSENDGKIVADNVSSLLQRVSGEFGSGNRQAPFFSMTLRYCVKDCITTASECDARSSNTRA